MPSCCDVYPVSPVYGFIIDLSLMLNVSVNETRLFSSERVNFLSDSSKNVE